MSSRIHAAAAALQLNRKLFATMATGGLVIADNDNLEVVVRGTWPNAKFTRYAGYDVIWRELNAA
jgi:hypothetical protein